MQRMVELLIAKRNEIWMKQNGAKIVKEGHYRWIVLTHTAFLSAIILEANWRHQMTGSVNGFFLTAFVLLQWVRVWCLVSLGRFWNTKIIVIPGVELIKRGPYKYVRHPNYVIVGLEFFVISLLFHAYIAAIVFPILHAALMSIRIPLEERALKALGKE
ncbi:isoprenylcysteine carboxyl methyltransferase family protein [Salinibacillus xinjiangensis]|nr:isoprenylcysteine carboxylmethyltransferase family protein [Salinibacillus xinjiangensis]